MSIQIVDIKRALTRAVGAPNKNGRFRCPCHGGYDFNLSLRDSPRKVQITCFSHGCDAKDILESVGLGLSAMYYDNEPKHIKTKNKGKATSNKYEYPERKIEDNLTPFELDEEIAVIDSHATSLKDSHGEKNPDEERLVSIAKARLRRHYRSKQEVSR